MTFFRPALFFALLTVVLFPSCKKDPFKPATIDLGSVRINDFQLLETSYTNITINHPVITDGVEAQAGTIDVVIPKGTTQLQLTPKNANFTNQDFTVLPALGTKQNFANGSIIYRLTSNDDQSKTVQYLVRIREEDDAATGDLQISAVSFRKDKNPSLSANIESARILHRPGNLGQIYIFVPAGTDFTSLTPTFIHNGTSLVFSQDPSVPPANAGTVYPAAGTPINFAFPRPFYAVVKRGTSIQSYSVIVDVLNPILLTHSSVTTANVKAGSQQMVAATTMTNQGNHPISIIGVDHSQQVPAGLNVVRGVAFNPSFGLLPGMSSEIKASVNAKTYPPGTYEVRASFRPRLTDYWEADDLLQPTALQIKTTIEK